MMNLERFLDILFKEVGVDELLYNYYRKEFPHGWAMPEKHSHQAVEFLCSTSGGAFLSLENDVVKLGRSNIVVVAPNIPHRMFNKRKERGEVICVQIDFEPVTSRDGELRRTLIPEQLLLAGRSYLELPKDRELEGCIRRIVDEMNHKSSGYEISVKCDVIKMLLLVSRLGIDYGMDETKIGNHYVRQALAYIEENIRQRITPDEIAADLHISKFYLMHLFKDVMNTTLTQYINARKISYSKGLLMSENLSIAEVAEAMSFSSPQYFSKLFKSETGVSPNRFRHLSRSIDHLNVSGEIM